MKIKSKTLLNILSAARSFGAGESELWRGALYVYENAIAITNGRALIWHGSRERGEFFNLLDRDAVPLLVASLRNDTLPDDDVDVLTAGGLFLCASFFHPVATIEAPDVSSLGVVKSAGDSVPPCHVSPEMLRLAVELFECFPFIDLDHTVAGALRFSRDETTFSFLPMGPADD